MGSDTFSLSHRKRERAYPAGVFLEHEVFTHSWGVHSCLCETRTTHKLVGLAPRTPSSHRSTTTAPFPLLQTNPNTSKMLDLPLC
jgi:hypothetical protein